MIIQLYFLHPVGRQYIFFIKSLQYASLPSEAPLHGFQQRFNFKNLVFMCPAEKHFCDLSCTGFPQTNCSVAFGPSPVPTGEGTPIADPHQSFCPAPSQQPPARPGGGGLGRVGGRVGEGRGASPHPAQPRTRRRLRRVTPGTRTTPPAAARVSPVSPRPRVASPPPPIPRGRPAPAADTTCGSRPSVRPPAAHLSAVSRPSSAGISLLAAAAAAATGRG